MGVDIGHRMSLQDLLDQGEQIERERWNHTSAVLAMQAELSRDRRRRPRPFTPDDFNPFVANKRVTDGMKLTVENLHAMRGMFQ